MVNNNSYPILASGVFLKQLEEPCIYNISNDELYEINGEALDFLIKCNGQNPLDALVYDEEFLEYCIEENLIELSCSATAKDRQKPSVAQSPVPSLRYLELQITDKCNLSCRHCYLGKPKNIELRIEKIADIFTQFENMQGIRMIVSGGEPLLHSDFSSLNSEIKDRGFRSILLTNGILINEEIIDTFNFQEVQVSIDGMEEAHDYIRGKGNFKKTIDTIKNLTAKKIDVSAATMITRFNTGDFDKLESMFREMGVREWSVDVPAETGYAGQNSISLFLTAKESSYYLKYGYGGGLYQSSGEFVCGAHLCAITPGGDVCKCGFFHDKPAGNIYNNTLPECWDRIEKQPYNELDCKGCEFIQECRGGCRYRAVLENSVTSPDSVKCFAYGIKK